MTSTMRSIGNHLCRGLAGHWLIPMAVLLAVILVTGDAFAQDSSGPPQPTLRKTHPAWVGYAVMFVLLVMVMLVSLMPSKRSHQD